jgi:hypothetical protein
MTGFSKKFFTGVILLAVTVLLLAPGPVGAQQAAAPSYPPSSSVSAPLVREGDFAAALESALGLGSGRDEAAAENRLSDLGIAPKNGWIADYPVTPDIASEIQQGVIAASDAGKLGFGRDEAMNRLQGVLVGSGLIERPYDGSAYAAAPQPGAPGYAYPDQAALEDYYASQGPPVLTYYAPPPDYSYLYSYVDYPFWYSGFWLPGFFILRDFHRPFGPYGRCFVSNHFVRPGTNTVYRVNASARLAGGAGAYATAPAHGFAAARSGAGMASAGASAGGFAQRSQAGAFRPGGPSGLAPRSTFSQPRVFNAPRVAMAPPHVAAPPSSGFSGSRSSFFSSSPAPSGSFRSSGSFGGGFSGGHSSFSGGHSFGGGGGHGGGGHGGHR